MTQNTRIIKLPETPLRKHQIPRHFKQFLYYFKGLHQ